MAVIENVIPILRVEASRHYYVGTLGFAWNGMPTA